MSFSKVKEAKARLERTSDLWHRPETLLPSISMKRPYSTILFMGPLTFWPSWKSDSESVGRVDFDRFPERKVTSTFLLMVSTLNRKFSYGKINVVGKRSST